MGEAAVAANGGAGGKVLGEFFSFAGDVDDAFAVGVFGAAEEGAEAELGGALGEGAGLLPVEVGVVVLFFEGAGLFGGGVLTFWTAGAAEEPLLTGPDLFELVLADGAVEVGELFGDVGALCWSLHGGDEVVPEEADELFPVAMVDGDGVEVVFHGGGKADVHDHGEVVFQEAGDDFAEFGGAEGPFFFNGVVAALDLIHDGGVGGGAPDTVLFELFD